MGKKGKKAQAGKPKKLTPKDVGKRLDVLAKKLEEELEGADLFSPLPPTEECAICLVPVSHVYSETCYQACCGNFICRACCKENQASVNKQNEEKSASKKLIFSCPFCREPMPTAVEYFRRLEARCLQNDHNAFGLMGWVYRSGEHYEGIANDDLKALDYYIRAAELGSALACGMIVDGTGFGVAVDKARVVLFKRVGALRGSIAARHNIGKFEYDSGNHEIGIRHLKIAAEAGYQESLDSLRVIYTDSIWPGKEFISKEYLDFAYRACHEAQMEVKSEERDKHGYQRM